MNHVVLFSSGIGSWVAAHRVVERMQPGDALHLCFTDTLIEDEDNYRFLLDASADIGTELGVGTGYLWWLADGRDVWEVFRDERYIGNTRQDPCSKHLKRRLARRWIETYFDPSDSTVYLGIDWTEEHRYQNAKPFWEPWDLQAPLCDPPYREKPDFLEFAESRSLKPPRLYEYGFAHANCGGFCVKQGQGSFKLLLETFPERYRYHEHQEEMMRRHLGKDVAIMRDRRGGTTTPLTLKSFRERVEGGDTEGLELDVFAGCGCMVDDAGGDSEAHEALPSNPSYRKIPLGPFRADPTLYEPQPLSTNR